MKKIFGLFFLILSAVFAAEETSISIVNKGTVLPKIIIKDNSTLSDATLKRNFYNLILNDLKISSNFEVLERGNKQGNYLLEYELNKEGGNALNLRVKIEADGTEKSNKSYSVPSLELYPFLAHTSIKDSVNTLGLAPVEWMDHKILIAKTSNSKRSQIIMADYTLTYQKVVVAGGLNLFPKWANKAQSAFYYTAYDHNIPTLYRYDLNTNKATRILSSGGMIVASDVSEDENKILVTMAPQDQPDVYLYDLKKKSLIKITNYSGVDVNGNFIENDQKVVFVSDRLGYPNLFMQKIGGSNAEQVVFHGRNNTAVSTYKNYIVYSSREMEQKGVFNIYLMSTESDYIRQLTANGKNLFPRFSSDGGSIVFIKYLGDQTALGIIRVNANKSFHFPLKVGKIQSIDW
ncbi:Tol-Pal system protein TolB [Campylobacter sp. MIT 97-5078]|uniref:Tol-Pal system protein TolB n=1 Tax=Campylobacter sp. MIT 97-5078 TaxID=1548153 RepID=UPI000512DB7A|nr:Tol-Pal system protein TolB [Campylobacter sp. MIT 97-5078]KGI56514.1 translocation protein TolB [Campylobacter sp. MIT 97-5078]TQR27034.1 Tol-Pal system protein TolB [Campylobacter sp. MIT 97-5078]